MDYQRYLRNYTRDVDAGLREQDPHFEEHAHRLLDRDSECLEDQQAILSTLKQVNEERIEIGEQLTEALADYAQLLGQQDANMRFELRRLLGLWPEQPPPGPIRRLVRQAFRQGFKLAVVYLLAMMNIIFVGSLAAALHVFVPAWVPLNPYPPWISAMLAVLFVWSRQGVLVMIVAFAGSMLVLVLAGVGSQVRVMVGG